MNAHERAANQADVLTDHNELAQLRRWKAEATEVILGLQDLGKALRLPLGERITGTAATEAARQLRTRTEAAEAETAALRARIEAIAGDPDFVNGHISVVRLRAALAGAPAVTPTETQAEDGACDCGHAHTPEGCTGPPTPSDLWAGVSPSVCDCDSPAPVADPTTGETR